MSGALAVAAVVGFGAVFGVTQNSGIAGTAVAATAQVNTDAAAGAARATWWRLRSVALGWLRQPVGQW